MQYYSCGSDKYTKIRMCDLELFSKIWSHINIKSSSGMHAILAFNLNYSLLVKFHHNSDNEEPTDISIINKRSMVELQGYTSEMLYNRSTIYVSGMNIFSCSIKFKSKELGQNTATLICITIGFKQF